MATMTTLPGGARTFTVPLRGPLPGAPFVTGAAELEIETAAPGDRPVMVRYRFRPSDVELKLKLPRLAAALGQDPWALLRGLTGAQGVVTYAGAARGLPACLGDLAALEAFLAGQAPAFDAAGQRPVAIAFEA